MMNLNNLLKWWQTIKISWSNYLSYRLNFFLLIIGPALVFFFIKYNLWSAIYAGDEELVLRNYDFEQMITYHVWALIVSLLAQGHTGHNLSEDIRMGRISSYLIYPFNFWEFHSANFLAFQSIQLIVSLITLFCIFAFGIIAVIEVQYLILGFFLCLWISLFWYLLQFLTGILGFWLEETWVLRVTLGIITAFLSGAIIPLDLYPAWLVEILNYTPFPYLTYYPIRVFMGETSYLTNVVLTLGLWGILIAALNYVIWKKGVRLYTAAGI